MSPWRKNNKIPGDERAEGSQTSMRHSSDIGSIFGGEIRPGYIMVLGEKQPYRCDRLPKQICIKCNVLHADLIRQINQQGESRERRFPRAHWEL